MDNIIDTDSTNNACGSNTEDNSHDINDAEMTNDTNPDKNVVGVIDTAVGNGNADGATQIENVTNETVDIATGTHPPDCADDMYNIIDTAGTNDAVGNTDADGGKQIENISETHGAKHYTLGVWDWMSIVVTVTSLVLYLMSIVVTATSLVLYLLDDGTDIHLAVEYSNKGLVEYFWATLACIIIPHLLLAITDLSMLWIDRINMIALLKKQTGEERINQGGGEMVEMKTMSGGNGPEVKNQSTGSAYSNGGNGPPRTCCALDACVPFDCTEDTKLCAFRVILGLLGLGIIIRKLQCIYYKFKFARERDGELRLWYSLKLLEAQRDSSNLAFICAFTEDCPQSLLQLYIFVRNPVPIYESIGRSIITSVINIPLSYANYYRATRRQPKDKDSNQLRKDLHPVVFLFYYLGLLGAIIVRVLSIGLFMGTVGVQCTLIVIFSHFIGQVLFIHFYQRPPFSGLAIDENSCSTRFSMITQTFFNALVNLFLYVDLNDRTRKKWRIVANNLVLYIENFTFLILSFTLYNVEYFAIYILVAGVGCLMHLVVLTNYYRILHPTVGLCFDSDKEVANTENHVNDPPEPVGCVSMTVTGISLIDLFC